MTAATLPAADDSGPSGAPASGGPEDFASLARRVRDAGLMGKRPGYYSVKIAATSAALLVLGTIGVLLGSSWWTSLVALGIAFTLAQLSFIAHDAGHRQVSRNRKRNHAIGMVLSNLCAGFSFGWWLDKHNRHHAHTNQPGKDPDLEPGALAYTRDQVEARRGLPRWFARVQAITLVPLLFLEAVNLHVAGAIHLASRRDRGVAVEAVLLLANAGLFFVAPFLVMGVWQAVVFVVVTQTAFGFYLGASFLTNHVGMPVPSAGEDLDYLRRQILTSRNLRQQAVTGFMVGGLDAQIEHHLFPTMPRANLKRARALVRSFCDDESISYTEASPWRAYADVFAHLWTTGAPLRIPTTV
jgi:fatty acid desaturase